MKPDTGKPQTCDRYGRTVALINCDGADANKKMVRVGIAWVFDKYVTHRGMFTAQDEARAALHGPWTGRAATGLEKTSEAAPMRRNWSQFGIISPPSGGNKSAPVRGLRVRAGHPFRRQLP